MAVAESDADVRKGISIFQQTLQEFGWKDGHNIRIDYRWGGADAERIQVLAKELVDQQPDILVGHSTPSAKGLLNKLARYRSFSSRSLTHWAKVWSQASRIPAGISLVSRYSSFHSAANGLKRSNRLHPVFDGSLPFSIPRPRLITGCICSRSMQLCLPWRSNRLQPRFITKPTSRTSFARSEANRIMAFSFCRTATMWSIVSGSSSLPHSIVCRRSIISAISHPTAGSSHMARMKWISSDAQRDM